MKNQHVENVRAALEMSQPCRCNGLFVCTRCKGLAALDALAMETDSRGVALIAAERARQVSAEGYTPEHDAQHRHGELNQAASYYCAKGPQEWVETLLYPVNWFMHHAKRQGFQQPTTRDLVKAGALIAAEIDRRLAAGEEA